MAMRELKVKGRLWLSMVRDWLQESRARGMSLGLENTRAALERLGQPQSCAPAIHVAGSNGKGTACAIISGALILSGRRTGTFTSPHLARVEERVRIDGVPVSAAELDEALVRIRELEMDLTMFEVTWLAACLLFEQHEVEIMVVETGLGGRLDATRTCNAIACLVTSISLEHTEILGDNIVDIALEKAAIADDGTPLVMKRLEDGVLEIETRYDVEWVSVENESFRAEAAHLARSILRVAGIDEAAELVSEAEANVRWPARMQTVEFEKREYLLDSAHNPSAMQRLCKSLEDVVAERQWSLIFGCSPQKYLDAMLAPLKELISKYPPLDVVCTESPSGRYPAVDAESIGFGRVIKNPSEALLQVKGNFIISCGSLYLQGDLIRAMGIDSDENLSLF